MSHWSDSWAFWAGLLAWMFGGFYLLWGWINRRPGGDGLQSLAPRPHAGRTRAIVPLASPASGRECVYYRERDEFGDLTTRPDDAAEARRLVDDDAFAQSDCGAFLVDSEAGTLLVWPTGGEVAFADGWSGGDRSGKTVYEKSLRVGTVVTVAGASGSFAEMMSEMSGAATSLPPDLLRALQTREDLRALRCFWGPGTIVTEGAPSEADETAAPWLDFVAAGTCMLLGTVLLYLSYTRFL